MHKLFWTDLVLVLLTISGSTYLFLNNKIDFQLAILITFIYISSKIIGYFILPYKPFNKFINHLRDDSKVSILSGFEIFKTTLVALLFIGFIFINPTIWILESVLVITMRIWGLAYIKHVSHKSVKSSV